MPPTRSDHEQGQLWHDYKQMTSAWLPASLGRLVRSRTFDRLLIGYAVYGVVIGGLVILALALGLALPGLATWSDTPVAGSE